MAKTILLIDDELDLVEMTKTRLTKSGYEVAAVVDCIGAFAYLEKKMPDLILLDLLLQGMQGEDFCKKLKTSIQYKNIPVILFTASSSNLADLTRELGAQDFVLKPYEPEELLGKIKRLVG